MDNGKSVLVTLTLTRADLATLLDAAEEGFSERDIWDESFGESRPWKAHADYVRHLDPMTVTSLTLPPMGDERGELEQ